MAKQARHDGQQVDHFVVGPDINQDGWRDVFVATLLGVHFDLYVDALSGKDGTSLWTRRHRLLPPRAKEDATPGRRGPQFFLGPFSLWDVGADGWPQLIATVKEEGEDDRGLAFVFSTANGSLTAATSGLERLRPADVDGDGAQELFAYCPGSGHGGKLIVVSGPGIDRWRRMDLPGQPAADLDQDGIRDVIYSGPDQLHARSGRAGTTLWRASFPWLTPELANFHVQSAVLRLPDLDDDGVSDILHYVWEEPGGRGKSFLERWPPIALSGRTGDGLWGGTDYSGRTKAQIYMEPALQLRDLDGDGHMEVVRVAVHGWHDEAGQQAERSHISLAVLNPIDTLMQVLENEPVAPRLLVPKLPRDLDTICLKCLHKEPHRRYGTAQELSDDLQRFLNEEPILARPIGPFQRAWRWTKRQRRSVVSSLWTAIVLVVLLIGTLAGRFAYHQWRLGYVTLVSDSRGLAAEFFDDRDRLVARNTIPMQKPIALASNTYRVRLSSPGRLSKDYQLFVGRGEDALHELDLEGEQLWRTMQIERTFRLVELEGRTDVILLDDKGLTRVHGALAKQLWSVELNQIRLRGNPLFSKARGFTWEWWQCEVGEPRGAGKYDRRPQVLSPAPDLDADGIGDVVVAAQHQAWLLAVSGASGEVVWVAPRGTDVTAGPPAPAGSGVTSASLGVRELGDVNDDHVSDVLVTFIDAGQLVWRTQREHPQRWVEAVCGRTGATLWRHDLMPEGFQGRGFRELEDDAPYEFRWFGGADPVQYRSLRDHDSSRFLHRIGVDSPSMNGERRDRAGTTFCWAPAAAERIMLGKQPVVMILAGTRVVLLDPSSGEPVQSPQDLSFAPARAPKLADLDADGTPELILIDQTRKRMADSVGRGVASDPDEQSHSLARLVTWSLSHAKELSSRECHSLWGMYHYWFCPQPEWPLVSDLNADGKPELLVPDGSTRLVGGNELKKEKWYNGKPGGGLSVLNGATCERLWARRLCSTHQQLDHFIVGPDIDAKL